ncbi:hypothetical protein [Nocardia asteroides]
MTSTPPSAPNRPACWVSPPGALTLDDARALGLVEVDGDEATVFAA